MPKSDVPFLKAESKEAEELRFCSMRIQTEASIHTGRWGSQLILLVGIIKHSGLPILRRVGIKIGSANMIALEKHLGKNLLQWHGRSFGLHVSRFRDADG